MFYGSNLWQIFIKLLCRYGCRIDKRENALPKPRFLITGAGYRGSSVAEAVFMSGDFQLKRFA